LIINTIGVGLVASIATVPFMAGISRTLKPNTDFLIHSPMLIINDMLNVSDLERAKSDLEPIEKQLIDFYKKGTGLLEEEIVPLVRKETVLNPSEAFDLKFATEYVAEQVKAVAYLKKDNLNNDNQMSNLTMSAEDKNWLEKLIDGAVAKFGSSKEPKKGFNVVALVKGTIVNVDVTDANGAIITFPDVADGTMPVVGDVATIDGKPAVGEYLMPDGSTFVFEDGALTQIVDPTEQEVDVDALNTEIADLKAQLETQKTNFTSEVVNLKKQITSRFEQPNPQGNPPAGNGGEPDKRKLLKD